MMNIPFQFSDLETSSKNKVGLPTFAIDVNVGVQRIDVKSERIHLISTKK